MTHTHTNTNPESSHFVYNADARVCFVYLVVHVLNAAMYSVAACVLLPPDDLHLDRFRAAHTFSGRSDRCSPVTHPCAIYCCEDMMKGCRTAIVSALSCRSVQLKRGY